MTHIEYFKLQAKRLFKDYKTQRPYLDEIINDYLYEYKPQYFDIDEIILSYDIDEENFSLMKAQHIIALMVGFKKWSDLLKAAELELELAKLLIDNSDKVSLIDWDIYITGVERDNNVSIDSQSKLEIFNQIFLNRESESSF
jgi:hypothetical protein